MEITAQTIITASAIVGAAIALYKYFAQSVRFIDRQKEQEKVVEDIKSQLAKREEKCQLAFANQQTREKYELEAFREEVNDELCVINYGLLACLKGMKEQGCNGPVTDAIQKLEKHLNQKAHTGRA